VENIALLATSTVLLCLQTDTDANSVVDGTARSVKQTEERGRPGIRTFWRVDHDRSKCVTRCCSLWRAGGVNKGVIVLIEQPRISLENDSQGENVRNSSTD
jgi:hypothetical protein